MKHDRKGNESVASSNRVAGFQTLSRSILSIWYSSMTDEAVLSSHLTVTGLSTREASFCHSPHSVSSIWELSIACITSCRSLLQLLCAERFLCAKLSYCMKVRVSSSLLA